MVSLLLCAFPVHYRLHLKTKRHVHSTKINNERVRRIKIVPWCASFTTKHQLGLATEKAPRFVRTKRLASSALATAASSIRTLGPHTGWNRSWATHDEPAHTSFPAFECTVVKSFSNNSPAAGLSTLRDTFCTSTRRIRKRLNITLCSFFYFEL